MTNYTRILYETTPEAVWLTLNRPNQLNLVDDDLFAELGDAYIRASRDRDHSVVVLRGSGRMFSGGGDLAGDVAEKAQRGLTDDEIVDMWRHVQAEYPVFRAIENCPKTTLAALNGDAYGAAVDIVMMHDLVLAVRSARLSFAPGRWGLCDTPNASRLARRVGLSRAKDLLFTARQVGTDEGMSIGLINRVCDDRGLDEAILALIEEVLTTSPDARRLMKQVMHEDLPDMRADEHFETAIGDEFREGVNSFLEKRPASWTAEGIAKRSILASLAAPPPPGNATSVGSGDGSPPPKDRHRAPSTPHT